MGTGGARGKGTWPGLAPPRLVQALRQAGPEPLPDLESQGTAPRDPKHTQHPSLPGHPVAKPRPCTPMLSVPRTCRYRTPFTEMVKSSLLFSRPTTASRELWPQQKAGQPLPTAPTVCSQSPH